MAEVRYMDKPWLKFYEEGVPENIPYKAICLPHILDRTAGEFPEKTALVFQGCTITFRQLQEMADRLRHVSPILAFRRVMPRQSCSPI